MFGGERTEEVREFREQGPLTGPRGERVSPVCTHDAWQRRRGTLGPIGHDLWSVAAQR